MIISDMDLEGAQELHKIRQSVWELMQGGFRALGVLANAERNPTALFTAEYAPVIQCQRLIGQPPPIKILRAVKTIVAEDLYGSRSDGLAADVMQALALDPDDMFSTASLVCYYFLVYDLNHLDPEDMSSEYPPRFVQLVRPLEAFRQKCEALASFLYESYRLYALIRQSGNSMVEQVEIERAGVAWYTSGAIKLKRDWLASLGIGSISRFDVKEINSCMARLNAYLKRAIPVTTQNFRMAWAQVQNVIEWETTSAAANEYTREQLRVAERFMNSIATRLDIAQSQSLGTNSPLDVLVELGDILRAIAFDVDAVIAPLRDRALEILDQPLHSSSFTRSIDESQLAVAAGIYAVAGDKQDGRVQRACRIVEHQSQWIKFPILPLTSTHEHAWLEAMALLSEWCDISVPWDRIAAAVETFSCHRIELTNVESVSFGWQAATPALLHGPDLRSTSLVLKSLLYLERILDHQINSLLLKYFTVTE